MNNDLIQRVRICMAQNMPKFVISLLVMGIITTIMMAFTVLPIATAIMSSTMNIVSLIALIIATLVISSLQYVLQYGFFVLVFLLYSGNYAVFGHLFSGFRDFKRAFYVGLLFSVVYMVLLFVFTLILTVIVSPEVIMSSFEILLAVLALVSFIVLAIQYIYFSFAWFLLYENSRISVKDALLQSVMITNGRKLDFIRFCIKCAGLFFPIGVVSLIVLQIPLFLNDFSVTSPLYAWLSSIVNVVYIICMYASLMRISIAFAAWYVVYLDSPLAIEAIDERYANLPKHDADLEPTEDTQKK